MVQKLNQIKVLWKFQEMQIKILTCERKRALNIITRMSGIATQTNQLVKKIPNKTKLYATRKNSTRIKIF